MVTREDIFQMMQSFDIRPDAAVTIHASLRSPGPIEGGADGLIDALRDYLSEGLLLIPTHTWDNVGLISPCSTCGRPCPASVRWPRWRPSARMR